MFAAHNTFHSAPEYKVMSIIPRQMTTVYGLPEHGMVWPVGDGFRKLSRWTWTCRLDNILHYITRWTVQQPHGGSLVKARDWSVDSTTHREDEPVSYKELMSLVCCQVSTCWSTTSPPSCWS